MHLCLVYFTSTIGKTNTSEWYKGVVLYYTLVSDRFNGTTWNRVLANNGYFVTLGTYFTLLFEFLFPFLIWTKRWRTPLVVAGVMLHSSIHVLMMIHDFQILFVAIYTLLYTDEEVLRLKARILRWPVVGQWFDKALTFRQTFDKRSSARLNVH